MYRRSRRLSKAARRHGNLCSTRAESAVVTTRNLRTADYSAEDRKRLGDAVSEARRKAGFKWRPEFVRAHDDVRISSLKMVELAKPGVGVAALSAIGRALGRHFPQWTEETPREILDGQASPALLAAGTDVSAEGDTDVDVLMNADLVGTDRWLQAAARTLRGDDLSVAIQRGLDVRREREALLQTIAERIRPGEKRGSHS